MMIRNERASVSYCVVLAALFSAFGPSSLADVSPPVSIKNVNHKTTAASGEAYQGEFEIHVYKPGELSDFLIDGEGWEIVSSDLPASPIEATTGTIAVRFEAVPADADQPLAISFSYNGRYVRKVFHVGPDFQAMKIDSQILTRMANSSGVRPGQSVGSTESDTQAAARGGRPIQVVGRIVYDRPGNDRSSPPDGDFNDPEDIPPATVGVDAMRVTLLDVDLLQVETIWIGYTDENGYFDSGVLNWDDCDPLLGCDVPDLVLKVSTITSSSVAVVDENSDVYAFAVPEMTDFTGTFHDYGVLRPAAGMTPAVHILSNINRARRFTIEEVAMAANGVVVFWPDDSRDGGAWYNPGSQVIHISTERQWRTDTIIHEYGHHHNNHFYGRERPEPSYCDAAMNCDPDPPTACGHCLWCAENAADAWFEGWADWFADVVTRGYPDRYTYDDGTPFEALYTRDLETPQPCGGSYDVPTATEGFVGALLRDIEDDTQDEHDDDPDPDNVITDGVFDSMCTGPGQVFFLTYAYDPLTVTEFIAGFLDAFPDQTDQLWPTAFNVGGSAFISQFPADTLPPGVVTDLDSPTHPLGQGGGLACMTFAFEPPDDDVKGANFYSYVVSDDPAGVEPDEGADPVRPGENCKIEVTVPIYELGEYYISIKAQDNDGNWSSQWAVFGPFEVLDCNNSGQLDICDIDCTVTSIPGMCNFGISPCGSVLTCTEVSNDCNGNWEPDECDVASRRSEDCDINGVPDECQEIKHWTGALGNPDDTKWGMPGNWAEEAIPVHSDSVCISAESQGAAVEYHQDDTLLTSLASFKPVSMSGTTSPWPDLELMQNSFILDDFVMSGNSTLKVDTRLYVNGHFNWLGGTIDGTGVTEVNAGLDLTAGHVTLNRGDFKLTGGAGLADSRYVNLNYGATFEVGTQASYTYDGNSYVFYGSNSRVHVRGEFTRNSGVGAATVFAPLDNDGTVHNRSGELVIGWGGTHTGQFISDPGTTLTLSVYGSSDAHELQYPSSLTAETLKLGNGTGNIHGTVDIADSILGRGGIWTFHDDADIVSYGQHLHVDLGRVVFEAPPDQPIALQSVTITTPGQSAGRVDFNTGQPVNVETFSLISGSLYGPSPINVSGTFTWTNGSIREGGAITADGPVVINATSSSRTISRVLNINDQASVYSGFGLGGNAAINIFDNVVFNMQFNSGSIGTRTINNFGTMLRSSGTGQVNITAAINNSGLIHNQTGTLTVAGGGTHTGDLLADPGTTLGIAGTGHDFQTSSTITAPALQLGASDSSTHGSVNVADGIVCEGCNWTFESDANIISYGDEVTIVYGQLHFDAPTDRALDLGTVNLPANFYSYSLYFDTGQPVNINTLVMSNNGSVYGSSPINIANQLTWSNGTFQDGGPLRIDGNATVNATSSARTMRRTLDNYGTMTIKGGFGTTPSAPINNMPGAVMDLQLQDSSLGLTGVINNDGTILKTTTAGNASLPNVVNRGLIDIQMGGIEFNTSYSSLTQTAGETILNDTVIEMFNDSKPFYLQGGLLKGNGFVLGDVDNSGGTVAPGLSVGEIEADDYTQGAGGVLEIEIGGVNPGEYDVLTVTGEAALAGELRVTDVNGFVPQSGDRIVILTATTVSGAFDTETVPAHYVVTYTPTEVALEVAGISPDLNGDGMYDLLDYAAFQACYGGPDLPPAGSCAPNVDADLDGDGDVDLDDYWLLFTAINQ